MKKEKGLVIGLLLVMSAIICFNFYPVSAQSRQIDSIEKYMSGTDTILNITVTHISASMPSQYNPLDFVDHIEIEIDEAYPYVLVNTADASEGLQHFSVQYNMGEVSGTPTIRARACNLQGDGEWFGPITVPEFSLIHLTPILMITSIAILLIKSKITTKVKK
ncbi:hypothetical protein AC477_01475 [miscellaneous Crenarchaeota group-1 archaeon SG8-32-1]|uniref:Uncharacterized protein n=1 Tax=miscellaneous Crenarchaeota group-1 archaeon SG8-32-1 TaxID=1685124 RepID=A0A0M0BZE6_9ARCH|nr:MAG: hypothetical protein AC477_01475 [miscellaneous Crenarchaeota group-1 archaeon SG8-32-1]